MGFFVLYGIYNNNMYTEERIKKVNKIIKDMVFSYEGEIYSGLNVEVDFQFQITGVKQMISVGDWHDHLVVDITIIDGDKRFGILHKLSDSLSIKDYRLLSGLNRVISEELAYFFNGDFRVHIPNDSVKISDEYQEKINDIDLTKPL